MGQFKLWAKQMKEDVQVPENVQERVNAVLAELADDADNKTDDSRQVRYHAKASKYLSAAAIVMAVCLLAGTVTAVAAVYLRWSRGIEKEFRLSDSQKQSAAENGLVVYPALYAGEGDMVSDTVDGVTMWIGQTMVDDKTAVMAFQMNGFDLPQGISPEFEEVKIQVDGEDAWNWEACFFNGLTGDGRQVYDDGTPFEYYIAEDGAKCVVLRFKDDEGNYEYDVNMRNVDQFDTYIGKRIEVCFRNLGYTVYPEPEAGRDAEGSRVTTDGSAETVAPRFESLVKGEWHLCWTLVGITGERYEKMKVPIGNTGVTLLETDITPVSLRVLYQTDHLWDTDPEMGSDFPAVVGVRLHDGTVYMGVQNGGTEGYIDTEQMLYEMDYQSNRVLDPMEIEALLFRKEIPDTERELTEDDCYVIEIKN